MKRLLLFLSLAGVLFSGYMSIYKLISDSCAFGETCPYFLGIPACYIGFSLFIILFILSLLLNLSGYPGGKIINSIKYVSFGGMLFAGFFTFIELPKLFEFGFSAYFFGLPTCALGLIFFVLIFFTSIRKTK